MKLCVVGFKREEEEEEGFSRQSTYVLRETKDIKANDDNCLEHVKKKLGRGGFDGKSI